MNTSNIYIKSILSASRRIERALQPQYGDMKLRMKRILKKLFIAACAVYGLVTIYTAHVLIKRRIDSNNRKPSIREGRFLSTLIANFTT